MRDNKKTLINLIYMVVFNIPIIMILKAYIIKRLDIQWLIESIIKTDSRQQILTTYALNRVNPYTVSSHNGLESIPDDFITSPWGLSIGNIFYPGFITRYMEAHYWLLLAIITFIVTTIIVVMALKSEFGNDTITLVIAMLASLNFVCSIQYGNASTIINCLLVMIVLFNKDYKVVTGILIGICMIKPQSTALICLILLLEKNIIPLIIGASIDILGWMTTSILVKTNPITLLIQFLTNGVDGYPDAFYGILTFLTKFGVPRSLTIIGSAIIGITLTIYGYKRTKDIEVENKYIRNCIIFSPAILCTQFWTYMWTNDKHMLLVAIIVYAWMLCKGKGLQRLLNLIPIILLNTTYVIYEIVWDASRICIGHTISVIPIILIYIDLIVNTKKQYERAISVRG